MDNGQTYEAHTRVFNSVDYEWLGDAFQRKHTSDSSVNFIEFVTSQKKKKKQMVINNTLFFKAHSPEQFMIMLTAGLISLQSHLWWIKISCSLYSLR